MKALYPGTWFGPGYFDMARCSVDFAGDVPHRRDSIMLVILTIIVLSRLVVKQPFLYSLFFLVFSVRGGTSNSSSLESAKVELSEKSEVIYEAPREQSHASKSL